MRDDRTLRVWERALIAALCVTLLLGAWLPGPRLAGWWCVMFPPLCLPAAEPEDAAAVFSDDEMRVLRPEKGFQVRFKLAEWLEDLWNAWEGGV